MRRPPIEARSLLLAALTGRPDGRRDDPSQYPAFAATSLRHRHGYVQLVHRDRETARRLERAGLLDRCDGHWLLPDDLRQEWEPTRSWPSGAGSWTSLGRAWWREHAFPVGSDGCPDLPSSIAPTSSSFVARSRGRATMPRRSTGSSRFGDVTGGRSCGCRRARSTEPPSGPRNRLQQVVADLHGSFVRVDRADLDDTPQAFALPSRRGIGSYGKPPHHHRRLMSRLATRVSASTYSKCRRMSSYSSPSSANSSYSGVPSAEVARAFLR